MSRTKHTLPLVFALAVSVEAGNAGAEISQTEAALRPGSFAGLLDTYQRELAIDLNEEPSGVDGETHQAQWGNFPNFPNFFNCFSGNWRNC
jgi:hypothetical protein